METNKEIEKCALCGRELSFWNTQLKRYEGKKICTKCAWQVTKKEVGRITEEGKTRGEPIRKFGKKLFLIGVTILLFFVGLLTFPIGIIFLILGIFALVRVFKK